MSLEKIYRHVSDHALLNSHPSCEDLVAIICGETAVSSAGFPYISNESFQLFVDRVPHLFRDGQVILEWLDRFDDLKATLDGLSFQETDSLDRGVKVIRTMVYTAAVTCLTDLWLLKRVLVVHKSLGILDHLLEGASIHPTSYGQTYNIDERQLYIDLCFLHVRGYVDKMDHFFVLPEDPKFGRVMDMVARGDVVSGRYTVERLVAYLEGEGGEAGERLASSLSFDTSVLDMGSWVACPEHIELGYRLVPLLLALRKSGTSLALKRGGSVRDHLPRMSDAVERLFERAGWMHHGDVTQLGARVFERGPGPAGIIYAYWPYLDQLEALLTRQEINTSVSRAANVAASQDANRKTFSAANDALDRFVKAYPYSYSVYVEHAVGQGEATRQRFERNGEFGMHYFGADLEDAAIDQAEKQQALGLLPSTMEFIRNADIGEPYRVIGYLAEQQLVGEPTVMVVGNGFHEIRNQSNEQMIGVFEEYRQAGFVLIFTEESALSDEDVINTAWNTYHAGFRYVHEMSGQRLRPIWDSGEEDQRWGWRRCAEEAGYIILDAFSHRSRKIYPFPRPDQENPSISMTYFCVPDALAAELHITN